MDRLLVLVRHGQSEWNLKNLFTGWKDPDLTEQGIAEAHAAGQKLKARGLPLRHRLYVSALTRAQHTLTTHPRGARASRTFRRSETRP